MKVLLTAIFVIYSLLSCKQTTSTPQHDIISESSIPAADKKIVSERDKIIPDEKSSKEVFDRQLPEKKESNEAAKKIVTEQEQTTAKTKSEKVVAKSKDEPVIEKEISSAEIKSVQSKEIAKTDQIEKQKVTESVVEDVKGIDHESFNQLLRQYVDASGVVNYKGLSASKTALEDYLQKLSRQDPQALEGRNEKMAFWINLYNAATIKLISDNYPLKSIIDLDGGKTWDVKRVLVNGQKVSLNYIENEVLRPQFGDARIHFAVNCAAKSCPPLANQAFTAENLNSLLQKRTKSFINDAAHNSLSANGVAVSKIFEWYAADFQPDLISYLQNYSSTSINAGASISYNEYDWSLNGK